LAPMMLSILAKVSVAKSPYRALRAKYSLKGLYFVPSLLGETNLLAQFKHTGTFLSTFFVPSEHDVVSAVQSSASIATPKLMVGKYLATQGILFFHSEY